MPPAPGTTPRLALHAVGKSFAGGGEVVQALDDVNLEVAAGEFVAVIGPSGCGKSTLLEIAAGLELPSSGEVLIDGVPASSRPGHAGYMPQRDALLPWRRILDNAALGLEVRGLARHAARRRVAPLMERFGLAGFEDAYPFQLSGGMRQRAALLRTVVQDCAVLLLDEPFGALDSLTRAGMQVWLEEVRGQSGWTVVLVTHDIREAVFLADRVVVLTPRPGSVAAELPIDLPRPRPPDVLGRPDFADLEEQLMASLRAHTA